MTSAPASPGRPGDVVRRGPVVAEIAALAALALADTVVVAGGPAARGLGAGLFAGLVPAFGPAAAVLAVLRRRFAARIAPLGAAVVALSLVNTLLGWTVPHRTAPMTPGLAESLAIALLAGAGCRRLGRYPAAALAIAGGLAMTAAPVLRYGIGSATALLAAPAALLWGGALAVGLILRDADARRSAALAEARLAERLNLARELHDLVAHHVTGIVVRAQAARVVAELRGDEGSGAEPYREIEEAGADALAAMRRIVGMLRTGTDGRPRPGGGLREVILDAASGHDLVATDLGPELDRLDLAPEAVTTVHRVVLEALTNVRRHAPDATDVRVIARVRRDPAALSVEVRNDGARGPRAGDSGYGLVGMAERVTALGGTFDAGAEPGHRWRVAVRLLNVVQRKIGARNRTQVAIWAWENHLVG